MHAVSLSIIKSSKVKPGIDPRDAHNTAMFLLAEFRHSF